MRRIGLFIGFFWLVTLPFANSNAKPRTWTEVPHRILKASLKFEYESPDGSISSPCQFWIENQVSHDWRVRCQTGSAIKDYVVHLLVREHTRETIPRSTFEVLYWITDWSSPSKSSYTGSTFWLKVEDKTALHSLVINQSVENDSARLWLHFRPSQI